MQMLVTCATPSMNWPNTQPGRVNTSIAKYETTKQVASKGKPPFVPSCFPHMDRCRSWGRLHTQIAFDFTRRCSTECLRHACYEHSLQFVLVLYIAWPRIMPIQPAWFKERRLNYASSAAGHRTFARFLASPMRQYLAEWKR